MSRIRYIKPEFFTDEDVARLSPIERILFAGLWTEADCRGRLTDKPVTLKVKLLPYDDCDVDAMLTTLHELGFIQRYEVQGVRYISIPNFKKHQRPHPKEADQGFPDPPEAPRKKPASRVISRQEIKGRPSIPSSPVGSEVNGDGDGEGNGDSGKAPPPFELKPFGPPPPGLKKPSEAEAAFAALQARRVEVLPEESPQVLMGKDVARWNKAFPDLTKRAHPLPLEEVWGVYLNDDWGRTRKPPCPWQGFVSAGVFERCLSTAKQRRPPPQAPQDPCAKCGGAASGEVWGFKLCPPCQGSWFAANPSGDEAALKAFTSEWVHGGRAA